jgi:hypothetical protein
LLVTGSEGGVCGGLDRGGKERSPYLVRLPSRTTGG